MTMFNSAGLMTFWRERRVLVTGGTGFVGSHVVEALLARGACVRVVGRSRQRLTDAIGPLAHRVEFLEGDLTSNACAQPACEGMEAVIHLAAEVAGVGYNMTHPATIWHHNMALALPVLDAAARAGVERFLCVSSACVYRRHCAVPTPESEGFLDDPEPTNFGYGWAKRLLEIQARCYAQEFPIKMAIARPYNAYGPRDNFDWQTSHVIPALIRKAVEGQDPLVVWGDGSQTRSFLYVTDLAEALLSLLERYAECDPVNIGTEEEITVQALVEMIRELSGSRARIVYEASRPQGQPRRRGDLTKARERAGITPQVRLREGLRQTIAWYVNHQMADTHPIA